MFERPKTLEELKRNKREKALRLEADGFLKNRGISKTGRKLKIANSRRKRGELGRKQKKTGRNRANYVNFGANYHPELLPEDQSHMDSISQELRHVVSL
jgi:hypothetical protein